MPIVGNPITVEIPRPRLRTRGALLPSLRPLPSPLRTGDQSQDGWWRNGVQWMPWGCDGPRLESNDWCAPVDRSATTPRDCDTYREQPAFTIWDSIKLNALGRGEEQGMFDRLSWTVNDLVSYALGLELMTGAASGGDGLSDVDVFLGTASDAKGALGALEQYLADTMKGALGLIHVTPRGLVALVTNGSVSWNGAEYISPGGHTVIADAGYRDSIMNPEVRPSADETWMFSSGDVFYKMDPEARLVGDGAGIVDISHDTIVQLAERQAILVFDPCPVASVLAYLGDNPVS